MLERVAGVVQPCGIGSEYSDERGAGRMTGDGLVGFAAVFAGMLAQPYERARGVLDVAGIVVGVTAITDDRGRDAVAGEDLADKRVRYFLYADREAAAVCTNIITGTSFRPFGT